MKVEILGGPDARNFLAAPDRWSRLLRHDELATAYQAPAYLTAYARHLPPAAAPLVLVVEDGTGPVAALALVREHLQDRPFISALGNPHIEYVRAVGPGAEDPAVARAFAQQIHRFAEHDEAVRLGDVPLDSALGRRLAQLPGWSVTTTSCATVQLPVAYGSLPSATRRAHQKRRAKWRQLEKDGRVDFRRCVGSALMPAWEALVSMYKARRGGARPPGERELRDVLAGPGVFIAQLSIDGAPVAADLCLSRGTHVYSLLPAMDPDWHRYAPGHALVRYLTAYLSRKDPAGEQRFTVFDMGRTLKRPGQRTYKEAYGPDWSATLTADSGAVGRSAPYVRARSLTTLQGAA